MLNDQYSILGTAPSPEKLEALAPKDMHLTIEGLNAGYGKMEILHEVYLYANRGQSICLIGPNGAGKSTILHSVYGFTNIFSGKITVDGNDITKSVTRRKIKVCRRCIYSSR